MSVSQNLTLTASEPDIANNSTDVRILWTSTQSGDSWNGYTRTAKYYVSINGGAETEYTVSYTLPQNATKTIVDKTITVTHKSDGSGRIKVRTWMDTSISAGVVQKTAEKILNVIPRATTIDALYCNSDETFATSTIIEFKYTPKSSSFYNRCYIYQNISGALKEIRYINIGKKNPSTQALSFSFDATEIENIITNLPNSSKGPIRVTLRTYSDSGYSTEIDNGRYKEITLSIPHTLDYLPEATLTVSPVSTLDSPFDVMYIKGLTKVYVDFLNFRTKLGATIKSYNVTVDGKSVDIPYTSGYLSRSGYVDIRGTITDSRGLSAQYIRTIHVIDYSAPQILPISGESEVIAARCDSQGNLSDNGTFLKIKAKRSYSKLSNKNTCIIRYRYKAEGGSYSNWTTILQPEGSDEVTTDALLYVGEDGDGKTYGALDLETSYSVQVQAIDAIGETGTTTITIATEKVYMHKAGSINSIGIGKYAEESNSIDIADEINVYGRIYGLGKAKVSISNSDDLNSFKTFGVYAVTQNDKAEEIKNIPVPYAGRLIVSSGNGSGQQSGAYTYILQEYITHNGRYYCYRELYTTDDESDWHFNDWVIRGAGDWIDLGFSNDVSTSNSSIGRAENGKCCYRVVDGNHVYVAFNCAFNYANAQLQVNSNAIPSKYRPDNTVTAICAIGGRAVARINVNSSGNILVEWIQSIQNGTKTESGTVSWVDGYIDYWI